MSTKPAEQLADQVAFLARLTPMQAADALRAVGTVIVNEVKRGHAVEFTNFGLFDLGERSDGQPAIRFRQHRNVREALQQ